MLLASLFTKTLPPEMNGVDGVELRLDLMPKISLNEIKTYLKAAPCPVVLTSRGQTEETMEQLLHLEPPFFDLDWQWGARWISRFPKTRFILSYHNFEKIPENLDEIYLSLVQKKAFACKIACMTHSASESLELLAFAQGKERLSVIPMGECGSFGRILAKIQGNLLNYGYVDAPTAPGQIPLSEWVEVFRAPSLNAHTKLFGLIGDPVSQSVSHLHHNAVFKNLKVNAVYVKIPVKPETLKTFLPQAVKAGFQGLSVTMPLKEAILPFLDEITFEASRIGAVNTVKIQKGKLVGLNTDGIGALNALEKKGKVQGKHIVLLGAGGAAKAIAFEAKKRGARLSILNRTPSRAEKIPADFIGSLEEIPSHYDILINATCHPMPIEARWIRPHSLVMDIIRHQDNFVLLKTALQKGCDILNGEAMFLEQAKKQTALWLE